MRVLITGAQGQVGQELTRLAPADFSVIGLGSNELDISNPEQVVSRIGEFKPQLIINAAAYTAVDKAETDSERAYAVNAKGAENLAASAATLGIPLLHISTDYVFSGDACTPYKETDPTGPTGVYGASKLAGELAVAKVCTQHVIMRTSWVFGAQGNNFVKTMLRLAQTRDVLGVVADQHGCPTSAASIAKALWSLASHYRNNGKLNWGTYHFSNMPATTWHGFAEEIFSQAVALKILTKSPQVNPINTQDYPTPARRPSWSVMDCCLIEEKLSITQSDWQDELREMLKGMAI
ncbi:dTDP-4-dehydrorhamnose reductase [Pseudomonas marincola]|uniref:dTDP-4-dehydrorhamnose reductase n=1 Tax=Pseudomonas marincola TaxID=437900 RepID=A0A653E8S2_9PSED|nr:dTDP-4-dehydrorhamnose reductase [Pseudomonas marincola]CAE6911077.1 dTDP-4-dehydrorhamnose reductase [Pseudomonas marincola]